MAKVYIVKEQVIRNDVGVTPMNYDAAMEFGEIEFITYHDLPMYGRSSVQAQWNADVLEFVANYNPETDFIVTTGQPTAIFAVGWALGRVNKTPRFLVWRREENRYRAVQFDGTMATDFLRSGNILG